MSNDGAEQSPALPSFVRNHFEPESQLVSQIFLLLNIKQTVCITYRVELSPVILLFLFACNK